MNKNFLIKEKENITGPLQEEKKEAVAFVERKINGLNLDYKWIAEANRIGLVEQIVGFYRLEVTNKGGWESQYDFSSKKSGWLEKIKDCQRKDDLKKIKECLGRVITAFGQKETAKFREITAKLTELETELKKNEVNQSRVNSLKSEIIPRFTRKTKGEYHDLDDFYYSPIVYTYFDKSLVEQIERQNQKTNQNQKSDTQYDYSSFQELEEGKHEIVCKYKELVTKIFEDYYDFDSESTSNKKWKRKIKEEYQKTDGKLANEILSDSQHLDNFHSSFGDAPSGESWSVREVNKVQLKARNGIIKNMEELIAKAEQGNNDKKRKREEVDNSPDTNKRLKSSKGEKDFEQLISEKNDQKDQATNQKIDSILSAAKKESDPQKLANLLEQIEKENWGKEIEESKKNEIRELKERMFDSNPQAKQEVISKLNNLLSQNNLSKEEHDKIAKELEDLDKEENKQEIIKKEESITEKIGIAGAQKKLNELVIKAKGFLQSNLLDKFQAVKKEVVQFVTDNGYNHKVYQLNKSEIDQLFAQTSSEQSPQEPTWKKAIVPISLSVGAIAIVAAALIVIKKKKQSNKVKAK